MGLTVVYDRIVVPTDAFALPALVLAYGKHFTLYRKRGLFFCRLVVCGFIRIVLYKKRLYRIYARIDYSVCRNRLPVGIFVSYIDIGVIGKRTRYGKLLDNRAVFPRVVGQRYAAEI